MRRAAPLVLLVACALSVEAQAPAARVLESFDDAGAFHAAPSDGVTLALRGDTGRVGRALRMDFDFQGRAGYAVARRAFHLDALPPYWSLTLWVRGETKPNTLELKLVDSTGLNVWWLRRPELVAGPGWTQLRFRPSDLRFAWGPAGGGPPRGIAALEIAFTAGAGGRGWLALDALTLAPQSPPVAESVMPRLAASSSAPGHSAAAVLPRDFASAPTGPPSAAPDQWRSAGDGVQWLSLDFGGTRALSALVLDWSSTDWPRDYDVERAGDDGRWSLLRAVRGSAGGRRFVHLPLTEATRLRIVMRRSSRGRGYALGAVRVLGDSVAATRTAFIERVAQGSAPGLWPRPLTGQQSYWTVAGLPHDERDALVSEDGNVESRVGSFSVEPFLYADGRLLSWRDGVTRQSLDGGWRPIPIVVRTTAHEELTTTVFVGGESRRSVMWVRYRVHNRDAAPRRLDLIAAVRPVQVNPPWQFLGMPGGAARVERLRATRTGIVVNDTDHVVAMTRPSSVTVASFDGGGLARLLTDSAAPNALRDPTGFAEGAIRWSLRLAARDSTDVWIALPDPTSPPDLPADAAARPPLGEAALADTRSMWNGALGGLLVSLPADGAELAATLHSALTHVLINARGPAIQPGTRSYRRSWIRDGALTSTALLRLGHASEALGFLNWYVPNVFPDGKVPCCVDARGADPVTENDADGELLYLAAEYLRVTGDRAAVAPHWPTLSRVAAHLDSLRRSRRTAAYTTPDSLLVFGLLPPSISHEGYSAKPAYSYWDDWWGVRGLEDAGMLAAELGDSARAVRFAGAGREMRRDVAASVARSMALHHLAVLPGAAELGDLDPTSSTIALDPAQALDDLPRQAVHATFDSAWTNLQRRERSTWDAFTPYEWRDVGAFIRLGEPERALHYARWLMAARRPLEWNQWGEVVWRDARVPKFIGDMPHGWVASDFIRATLDMIAYERARDSVLVVGAGIPVGWARDSVGVTVRRLFTWWGPLDLDVRTVGPAIRMTVSGVNPSGGIELHAPFGAVPRGATIDGAPTRLTSDGRAVMVRAPAVVEFLY